MLIDSGRYKTKDLARLYCIGNTSLSNYYVNLTSDFAKDKIENGGPGLYQNIARFGWINVDNLGPILCIDEKNISGHMFTILSNPEKKGEDRKGSIVAIVPGVLSEDVIRFIKNNIDSLKRSTVKMVAMDMSSTMEAIIRGTFPLAIQVTDYFHLKMSVNEDMTTIKVRIKHMIKAQEEEAKKQAKKKREEVKETRKKNKEAEKKNKEAKKILEETKPKASSYRYITPRYVNGETPSQAMSALQYQVCRRSCFRTYKQRARRKIICSLDECDDIVTTYNLVEKLYEVFEARIEDEDGKKKILNTKEQAKELIEKWLDKAYKIGEKIPEVKTMANTIFNRLQNILNYFVSGHSNGFAEGINSCIQDLIGMARGFLDINYTLYRIIKKLG